MLDLAYPVTIENGTIATVETPIDSTRQHIQEFLETLVRERRLLPSYGMPDLVFLSQSLRAIEAVILSNLVRWFPGYRFTVRSQVTRVGTVAVTVTWIVDALTLSQSSREQQVSVTLGG